MSQHALLQLREGRNVQINIIVEETYSSANDRASVEHWEQSETDARREISFTCYVVPVESYAVINTQPATNVPLVLKIRKAFLAIPCKPAATFEVQLFSPCSIRSQDAHRVAEIAAVVRNVAQASAKFHHVRTRKIGRTE